MTKAAKRSLIVAIDGVAVVAAAFLIARLIAPPKDLRAALAAALHRGCCEGARVEDERFGQSGCEQVRSG